MRKETAAALKKDALAMIREMRTDATSPRERHAHVQTVQDIVTTLMIAAARTSETAERAVVEQALVEILSTFAANDEPHTIAWGTTRDHVPH